MRKKSSFELQSRLVTFDQCMEAAGMQCRYQKFMLLLFTPYWIISSIFIFQQLYTFQEPTYICNPQFNYTQKQCMQYICSDSHVFNIFNDIKAESTYTYQFQLFCNQQFLRLIFKIFPQVLAIIGYIIYGMVGDQKGRIVACKISWRFFILGLIFQSLSKTKYLILFGYAIASIHCLPTLVLQFSILFEVSNERFRSKGSLVILASNGVGIFILSIAAAPTIVHLNSNLLILLFCTIPAFLCGLFLDKIIESIRFIYGNNKIKALTILNKIAQRNNRERLLIDLTKSYWVQNFLPSKKFLHYTQAFFFPSLRKKLIIGFLMIFCTKFLMTYSQIMLDPYLNPYYRGIIMASSTSASSLILCFYIMRTKRSITNYLILLFLVFCIYSLMLYLMENNQHHLYVISIIFSIIIRLISTAAFSITLIWALQTFPTVFRVMGLSFVMIGESVAVAQAYFLKGLNQLQNIYTIIIILLLIPISLKMPDTLGNGLKDDLAQENFWKNDKFYKI